MFKRRARHVVLHAQHLGGRVTGGCSSSSRGRVVATGNQRGSRHGNTRVRRHGHGRRSAGDFLLLDGVQSHLARRVHGGIGVRRGMRSSPRISELRGVMMRQRVMVVNTVEAHPAILAVLVLDDHRHGDCIVWERGYVYTKRRQESECCCLMMRME